LEWIKKFIVASGSPVLVIVNALVADASARVKAVSGGAQASGSERAAQRNYV